MLLMSLYIDINKRWMANVCPARQKKDKERIKLRLSSDLYILQRWESECWGVMGIHLIEHKKEIQLFKRLFSETKDDCQMLQFFVLKITNFQFHVFLKVLIPYYQNSISYFLDRFILTPFSRFPTISDESSGFPGLRRFQKTKGWSAKILRFPKMIFWKIYAGLFLDLFGVTFLQSLK